MSKKTLELSSANSNVYTLTATVSRELDMFNAHITLTFVGTSNTETIERMQAQLPKFTFQHWRVVGLHASSRDALELRQKLFEEAEIVAEVYFSTQRAILEKNMEFAKVFG